MRINKITITILLLIVVAGCSRFDLEKIPLYDEIMIPEEQGLENPTRRPPPYNHEQEMNKNGL